MKTTLYKRVVKWSVTLCLLAVPIVLVAQDGRELSIPLSNPGEKGTLQVNLVSGSISVTTHNGSDVLIRYTASDGNLNGIETMIGDMMSGLFSQNSDDSTESSREGLTRIPNPSHGIEVTERLNVVTVDAPPLGGAISLDIHVPENFSLKLSNVHSGDITVEGVTGMHEISSVNGRIIMTNISGSVVANTVNGDMLIRFDDVYETTPMSFTTVNGDIDLGLPGNTKFSTKIITEFGEILSDFTMDLNPIGVNRETSQNSGTYQVSVDRWITSDINGGGPEYVFRSLNGDVIIRQHD